MGFHYFARGTVASHGHFRIVRSGTPVQIHGLVVKPGDVLHGDENGLISVPKVDPGALKDAVERVRAKEKRLMEYVRGPEFSLDGVKPYQ
jgi:regulator of RNase E activity RraA